MAGVFAKTSISDFNSSVQEWGSLVVYVGWITVGMLVAVSIVLFIEALRRTKEVRGGSNWAKDLFHFLIALLLLVGALCAATLAGILLNVLLQ